jgi:hypothetical protein
MHAKRDRQCSMQMAPPFADSELTKKNEEVKV